MRLAQRILRLTAITVAAVAGLALAAYLVVNVSSVVTAHGKRAALSDQITQRIAEVRPTSQARLGTVSQHIEVPPDHTWVAQRCAFDTDDSGWMVNNYREACALESVHVWQVDSEAQARGLLGVLGQVADEPSRSDSCLRFDLSSRLGEQDPFADSRTEVTFAVPGGSDSQWCLPTHQSGPSRRGLGGPVPNLDASQGWLVVVQTDELIDEAIGCAHWSVIFCDNPFGKELAWGQPSS